MTDQWAYDRVRELVDAQTQKGWHDTHTPSGVAHAFARYVFEHEEAPDPVEVEVARLLPNANLHPLDVVIRNAIKCGIELAKTGGAA